jgi:RNA polymerase sigma factor, sigma-70 family
MTNEELTFAAAQGDIESLNKLYFAVAPLLYKLIKRYFPFCNQRTTPEDLLQCGYFAVVNAVKYYSPDKGCLFSSYLGFFVKQVCYDELGFRKKQVNTISLETPISDAGEGDLTLGDTIFDPNADTCEYNELNDMRLIVRKEIERLPSRERCVIYGIFYDNKTMDILAQELGREYGGVISSRDAAFNSLRRSKGIRELRKAYNWNNKHPSYLYPEKIIDIWGDSGLEPI